MKKIINGKKYDTNTATKVQITGMAMEPQILIM